MALEAVGHPGSRHGVLRSDRSPSDLRKTNKGPFLAGNRPLTWVGVAGFEPAASSSRSQVYRSSGWAYLGADLWRVSVNVCGGPLRYEVVVTQLVTSRSVRTLPLHSRRSIVDGDREEAAVTNPDVMGGPEPDEQRTDLLGGTEPG